jgi:NAD(P)-dependent dehydrogenase (short-subunit alcohol dehydrogenase family)
MSIPPEELEICLKVLQQISADPTLINAHERCKTLIAKIYKNGKKEVRRTINKQQQIAEREIKAKTAMVQSQIQHQSVATFCDSSMSGLQKTNQPKRCYICKKTYTDIHFFYHLLCPNCAEFNYHKRTQSTDLTGRVALITGGRIKIGYQLALRMLRDGARVIVTTRFPHDSVRRFSTESDFNQWCSRLQIHGLDLRHIPAVEAFVNHLSQAESSLDIIINNAAQTIKRPLQFYQHLLDEANQNLIPGSPAAYLLETQPGYQGNLTTTNAYFPANTFDADGQQIDLRPINSWMLKLNEVKTGEMLEVQLVNAVSPFIFNSQLKPLMMRSQFKRRFIINVSAMEGQFNRENKTVYHPHTNMAKAALNMMTRTSSADYACDGIFMNSVDTGWITDENPYPKKTYLQETQGFYPPLDVIDGMARIYDPIVQGIENIDTPLSGHFLKDYLPHPW